MRIIQLFFFFFIISCGQPAELDPMVRFEIIAHLESGCLEAQKTYQQLKREDENKNGIGEYCSDMNVLLGKKEGPNGSREAFLTFISKPKGYSFDASTPVAVEHREKHFVILAIGQGDLPDFLVDETGAIYENNGNEIYVWDEDDPSKKTGSWVKVK